VTSDRPRAPGGPDPLLDAPDWAPSWLPTVDDVHRFRVLRWLVGAVFVAGLAACVTEGADSPADPELGAPLTTTPFGETGDDEQTGDGPAGGARLAELFGTVVASLTTVGGEVLELCLLHADEPAERSRGLMGVTSLGDHDGMLFSMDEPTEGSFYMFQTLVPLRIGWWDAQGELVRATDMVPCESEDPAACERYPSGGPYVYAIEVLEGSPLGATFVPGTRLEVTGGSCPA